MSKHWQMLHEIFFKYFLWISKTHLLKSFHTYHAFLETTKHHLSVCSESALTGRSMGKTNAGTPQRALLNRACAG